MDVLAEKLLPWERMDYKQRLAVLKKRTSTDSLGEINPGQGE
jgi:hypothetical protein